MAEFMEFYVKFYVKFRLNFKKDEMDDKLILGGREFSSRLIMGSG